MNAVENISIDNDIVEHGDNLSINNDVVVQVGNKSPNKQIECEMEDYRRTTELSNRCGLCNNEIVLTGKPTPNENITSDVNDNESGDKMSLSDCFNYVDSSCSGTSTLKSAPKHMQIHQMKHDEKSTIPVINSNVLSDSKSGDEIIKDGIYPLNAVNMEHYCTVQAKVRTSGSDI